MKPVTVKPFNLVWCLVGVASLGVSAGFLWSMTINPFDGFMLALLLGLFALWVGFGWILLGRPTVKAGKGDEKPKASPDVAEPVGHDGP